MEQKTKVYIYTRVSTAMQIDGYSLDAQRSRMKAYAEFNNYEIVGEYEDAGKSGKSIEGRDAFNRMMEDIKTGKDHVSYVLVFKLSRFGRNAADVLSTLQTMQDFGVNLVCVEDGIDSSKDAGKLMISVLSAVAEIERENIRVQTMEGRMQKAREGKWNGGIPPYGYRLKDGVLYINKDEAPIVRQIFELYATTNRGSNGVAKYLTTHGVMKENRITGKPFYFDAHWIRRILQNPVYCGKIAYGRRKTEKVRGSRNQYKIVNADNYLLVDGLHEGIVSDDLWQKAQVKMLANAKKHECVRGPHTHTHLLSGLLRCPVCGAAMYGNKSNKKRADGSLYKSFYYYGCKHHSKQRGYVCTYNKQVNEEVLDEAVIEIISELVSRPKFAAILRQKINIQVDTSNLEQEIHNLETQLKQFYTIKKRTLEEIERLDPDDKHYNRRKSDLDDRIDHMYDKIDEYEQSLIEAKAKKQTIEADKISSDNVYNILTHFDKLFAVMDEKERRQLMEILVDNIQIYPERQPNGQWLKSITFKLPIVDQDIGKGLDNGSHVETCVLLSKLSNAKHHVDVEMNMEELDVTASESKATYQEIREWVEDNYHLHVTNLYIAQVKREYGIIERPNYHLPTSPNSRQPHCPKDKAEAIKEAMQHFQMI